MHVVLKFGMYVTKIDVFQNGSPRDVFRRTRLVGKATDEQFLIEYSAKILLRYIEEETIWLENLMCKTSLFIITTERVFDDVILQYKFSFKSEAFTMTSLYDSEMKNS